MTIYAIRLRAAEHRLHVKASIQNADRRGSVHIHGRFAIDHDHYQDIAAVPIPTLADHRDRLITNRMRGDVT